MVWLNGPKFYCCNCSTDASKGLLMQRVQKLRAEAASSSWCSLTDYLDSSKVRRMVGSVLLVGSSIPGQTRGGRGVSRHMCWDVPPGALDMEPIQEPLSPQSLYSWRRSKETHTLTTASGEIFSLASPKFPHSKQHRLFGHAYMLQHEVRQDWSACQAGGASRFSKGVRRASLSHLVESLLI